MWLTFCLDHICEQEETYYASGYGHVRVAYLYFEIFVISPMSVIVIYFWWEKHGALTYRFAPFPLGPVKRCHV